MKYLFTLLTLFSALTAYGAASGLNGEVLVNVGTSGTNAVPGSRATNTTILAQSSVGSGTNVFQVNAATTHTAGNLVEVRNNGTNVASIHATGRIDVGRTAQTEYNPATPGPVFVGEHDVSAGEADRTTLILETVDSPDYNYYSQFNATASITDSNAPASTLVLSAQDGGGNSTAILLQGGSVPNLEIQVPSTRTLLSPAIADGSTPYQLGTSLTHTSGNLVEVQNNGTNQLIITHYGGIGTGGGLSPDDFGTMTPGDTFIAAGLTSVDGRTASKLLLKVDDSLDYNFGFSSQLDGSAANVNDSYGRLNISGYGTHSGGWSINGGAAVDDALLSITGTANGDQVVLIIPSAAATQTPLHFDTTITHTAGNLLEIQNHDTNKFAVDFLGSIQVSSNPPANAGATGVAGTITWDSGFIYVCVAADTWKRVAIATWP